MATTQVVAFAAVAHTSAGGALPSADVLATLALVTGAVSWALHERLLRLGPAALLVATSQLAVHLAAPASSAGASHSGHLHAVAGATDSQMLLAHVVSAAATVMALAWQEHALVALTRALAPASARLVPAHRAPRRPGTGHMVRRVPALVLGVAPLRGPPAVCAYVRS